MLLSVFSVLAYFVGRGARALSWLVVWLLNQTQGHALELTLSLIL